MNRLPSVIGLAPSELSLEIFKEKLTGERNRVRESLEEFRLRRMGKSAKRKPSKAKGIAASLKSAGLSKEDFLKGIELLKQLEGEKNA